ncbi:MAG: metallophosphoesterase [Candidatus Omnitrophica bacterium]|nr:metallophosphoesterase [Candidatus Omnitrophota bacterium]
MRIFLIVFFLIYGSIHLYAFLKAKTALSLSSKACVPLIIFMAVMTSSPVIVRNLERFELEFFARLMSYTGYIWMGLLILFFSLAVCMDIYRLLVYLLNLILHKDLSAVSISAKLSFFIPVIFALSAGCYGYFEARDIQIEHLKIKASGVPEEGRGLKIVQISDVHAGLIVREERLKDIIKKVKAESPDILVSTGDLVDGQINRMEGFAEIIREIKPRYGKFAITGNHEYYAGLDQALEFTRRAGFTILRGEAVEVAGIYIAGVDDPAGDQFGKLSGLSEKDLLSGLDRDKFKILLKHRPLVINDGAGLFDLQLSGHTHKGQIFPFNLVTMFYYPKHAGHLDLQNGSHLYVSRGTGTWGPPIRFFSPPEVTVIELVHED